VVVFNQVEQIEISEGYDSAKSAPVKGLVAETIVAIQKLEDDYVHK
jgi:hypothetical protein